MKRKFSSKTLASGLGVVTLIMSFFFFTTVEAGEKISLNKSYVIIEYVDTSKVSVEQKVYSTTEEAIKYYKLNKESVLDKIPSDALPSFYVHNPSLAPKSIEVKLNQKY